MRSKYLLLFLLLANIITTPIAQAQSNLVVVATLSGEITDATYLQVSEVLSLASSLDARLVVLSLDTPGGQLGAVQSIMETIESSSIPVCVYVSPLGAAAWSGGTYVLISSAIAAMASGTSIGSAQPVQSTGILINDTKTINALTALMINHAALHSRNTTIAKLFITQNLNLGPGDALKYHVIEIVTDNLTNLLVKISQKSLLKVETTSGETRWSLVDTSQVEGITYVTRIDFQGVDEAQIVTYTPGAGNTVLQILLDPIVSAILLILGLLLLIIGIHSPGLGAELAGSIMLILALYSFQIIGIEPLTIIVFVIGFALIIAELKTHIGVLAAAGLLLIGVGGLILFPSPQWLIAPDVVYSIRNLIAFSVVVLLTFFGFLLYKVIQVRRSKVRTGYAYITGTEGVSISRLAPRGEVRVSGEVWGAESMEGEIEADTPIIVVRREGLTLYVKKKPNQGKHGE